MENSLMKFKITNDKLKMEIKISDLIGLFGNSPNNVIGGTEVFARVKRGKKREFAEWVVQMLQEESSWDENNVCWGQPFEDVFNLIFEGFEVCDEFIEYRNE